MAYATGQVFYYTGKYGVQTDFYFSSMDPASTSGDLYNGTAWAAGDATISKDGGAEGSTTNTPAQITASGFIHKLTLTATEMQASRILVTIRDQTASEAYGPVTLIITVKMDLGAIDIDATQGPGNRTALAITGNGSGSGILSTGGATGNGAKLVGGGGSGTAGLYVDGGTAGSGLYATAGASSTGVVQMVATGATNASGLKIIAGGTGHGIDITVTNSGSGAAISAVGGNTSGSGIVATATGTGKALNLTAGATGVGVAITGGATSGDAVQISATTGHGLSITPGGTGKRGIEISPVSSELFFIRKATAAAGAAGTITLDAGATATDNYYNETIVVIIGGTGIGQSRYITGYVGATKVATVSRNWSTTPDATSIYIIIPGPDVWDCLEGAEFSTAPADNSTFRRIAQYLKRWFTNKKTQTNTTQTHLKDDSTTTAYSQTVSDDGTTATVGKAT